MTLPSLRVATAHDVTAVQQLLADVGLTTVGVAELFERQPELFVVADAPDAHGRVIAVAGLERCGTQALLRSVAVDPAWRVHGLGQALVKRIVCMAEERGLDALYLLTMTAEHYFPRFGFNVVAREQVPSAIADTLEFRSACPASAVAMEKSLAQTV